MPFTFTRLRIPGLVLVESRRFEDPRGSFMEAYQEAAFAAGGIGDRFVQGNLSRSLKGTLRGLHFQKPPKVQAKLLLVLKGAIFDVAVDLRRHSPTFGEWEAVTLAEGTGRMLYVPEGFAHGFCVTSEEAEVLYQVSAPYAPELDRGVLWSDPALAVPWPAKAPVLSAKDAVLPLLRDADNPF